MPSWGIHLLTGNELLKRINITDKNAFLIGNFMPDAERYVVKDFSIFVPYNTSHFAEILNIQGNLERLPNFNKFIAKYKNNLNNPLILGYLTHLLTDYYWNNTVNSRYTERDKNGNCIAIKLNNGTTMEADKTVRRILKHNDFHLFEREIKQKNNLDLPVYKNNLINYLKELEETKYNKNDFIKIVNYLNNLMKTEIEDSLNEYRLYTKEQIKVDFNDSIEFILNILKINTI